MRGRRFRDFGSNYRIGEKVGRRSPGDEPEIHYQSECDYYTAATDENDWESVRDHDGPDQPTQCDDD